MTDPLLEISLPLSVPDGEERLQAILYMHGSTGATMNEQDGYRVVLASFADRASRDAAATAIRDLDDEIHTTASDRAPIDWLLRYEQSLQSMDVGTRFVVSPDPSLIGPGDRIPLIVPQERVFGTGSHETTALCLEMLESLEIQGQTAIDIGSGSGILAIALAKLGAERVIALDNDFETIEVLEKNLLRNAVANRVVLRVCGTADAFRSVNAGVAVMNIIPEVIIPELPQVASLVGKSGSLVLSGILKVSFTAVIDAARASGFSLVRDLTRGEWWCGWFVKESTATE